MHADPYGTLFEPRRIWVPQTASGGTNTYTLSPSGSFILSGTSPLARERAVYPSGGFSLSGSATQSRERAITPSGGISLSGTAPLVDTATYALNPSGGIIFSGDPVVTRERVLAPSGGVTFNRSAKMTFVPAGGVARNDMDRISVGVSKKIGVS
jgi:hypothetical protein